jgi:hypothetical protein
VVSSRVQSLRGKPIGKALQEIDPTVALLVLEENFATQDPGEAAERLLSEVSSRLAAPQ